MGDASKIKAKQSKKSLDYKQLEDNLKKEIEAEKQYWLENDAKLRAVSQGTHTYEDFRQIVLGAHLQPMKKEDRTDFQRRVGGGKVVWNSHSGGDTSLASKEHYETGSLEDGTNEVFVMRSRHIPEIRTSADLLLAWKWAKGNPRRQWNLLRLILRSEDSCPGKHYSWDLDDCFFKHLELVDMNLLGRLWRDEIPFDIFPSCIPDLLELLQDDDMLVENWNDVVFFLQEITRSRRFRLTMSFLSSENISALEALLRRLSNTCNQPGLKAQKNIPLLQQVEKEFLHNNNSLSS